MQAINLNFKIISKLILDYLNMKFFAWWFLDVFFQSLQVKKEGIHILILLLFNIHVFWYNDLFTGFCWLDLISHPGFQVVQIHEYVVVLHMSCGSVVLQFSTKKADCIIDYFFLLYIFMNFELLSHFPELDLTFIEILSVIEVWFWIFESFYFFY